MAQILSVPFRLAANGTVATVTEGTDQANAEQLSVIVRTIQGEREMQPGFGLPDPAFNGISLGDLTAQVALWGPAVTVNSATPSDDDMTTQTLTVDFT